MKSLLHVIETGVAGTGATGTESVTVNQEWGSGMGVMEHGEIKMNFTQLKTNIQNFIEDDSTELDTSIPRNNKTSRKYDFCKIA